YRARIVRLFHGDRKPPGPGLKVREVAAAGEYAGREQPYRLGSYAVVDPPPRVDVPFSVSAEVFPTTPCSGGQSIVDGGGWALFVEKDGDLAFRIGDTTVRTAKPLRAFAWCSVRADVEDGRIRLEQ